MRNPIAVAVEKVRGWSNAQRALALVLALGLCVGMLNRRNPGTMSKTVAPALSEAPSGESDYLADAGEGIGGRLDAKQLAELQENAAKSRDDVRQEMTRSAPLPVAPGVPLIAHTEELALATKEFARSRGSLEEIVERHRGYAAKLRMVGKKSGSVLSATLRVPSTELGGTVSDLKTLGDVEREEQAADEITQQRADLEARLSNAQNTLRRLQELLQKQTYPDGNVRELQRQIANASAEVARLQAERQSSEQRVVFANVYFTMREEVATPSETLGAELKSAAAAGFGEAAASLSALLVFLIGRGPVVLLWCAILFLPVRFAWRKLQPAGMAHAE